MASLQELKLRLKNWETEHYKKHGRRPDKDEIATAPPDIQDAYKEYSKLKKQTQLEQNKVEVWGAELHKKHALGTKENGDSQEKDSQSRKKPGSIMSNIGQKLLERSNLQLSTSKKSGLQREKSRNMDGSAFHKVGCTPVKNQEDFCDAFQSEQSDDKLRTTVRNETASSQSSSEDITKPKKNKIFEMATQWSKQRSKSFSGGKQVLGQGECALDGVPSSLAIHKSRIKMGYLNSAKTNNCASASKELKLSPSRVPSEKECSKLVTNDIDHLEDTKPDKRNSTNFAESPVCNLKAFGNDSKPRSIFHNMNISLPAFQGTEQVKLDSVEEHRKPNLGLPDTTDIKGEVQVKNDKSNSYCSNKSTAMSDIFDFNNSVTTKAVTDNLSGSSFSLESGKIRRGRKRKNHIDSEDEEDSSQKSDIGWGHDEQMVLEEVLKNAEPLLGKQESEEESSLPPAKKKKTSRSAPVSNDNFIRLNMKVKTYRRKGGGGMTGGKWKRMQWKQKMKARSESFGSGKCFKCGQEGHWANKCKGAKGKYGKEQVDASQWSGSAEGTVVDDKGFPSLHEAAQMAQGVRMGDQTSQSIKSKGKEVKKVNEEVSAANDDTGMEEDEDEEDYPDVVRSGFSSCAPPPPLDPLFSLNEDGDIPGAPPEVFEALKKFGYSSFRTGQEQAVMRILCGESTLVVLSTGAGKSLCYQLPAYMYRQRSNAITLVISPLVSLMEDQVMNLPACVNGACLHSNMTHPQRDKVMQAVNSGALDFLLISPEALVGSNSGQIKGINKLPPIAFVCIDEAHCVSEWSHHFRPTYLRVCKVLKERFGVKCMLGLTATATMVTAASVAQHLGIADYKRATIRGAPVPPNLYLSVSRDGDKDDALISLLQGDRFSSLNSIIVYCTRRDQTERLACLIRTLLKDHPTAPSIVDETLSEEAKTSKKKYKSKPGRKKKGVKSAFDAECYHAGLTSSRRRRVQNAFMSGQLRVVVATVAFGMGLDKADVRGIIHYNLPKSFESYVQEIGRAGRDGLTAHCHLFLEEEGQDMSELKRHIYGNTVDRFVIKKLIKKVFPRCRCEKLRKRLQETEQPSNAVDHPESTSNLSSDPISPRARKKDVCPGHERAIPIEKTVEDLDVREEGLSTLLCYLELHPRRWIENLTPVYSICRLQCYGGPLQLQAVAKKCPPVAVAVALEKKRGVLHAHTSDLEFPIVEVSDTMGWDSGPVKKELKLLAWELSGGAGPRKSGVMVEFTDLSFHLRSPGNLTDEEIDEVVDFLTSRVTTQELAEIFQLKNFYDTLLKVAHKNYWMCSDHVDENRSNRLKGKILEYFDQQPQFEEGQVTMLSFARELDIKGPSVLDSMETSKDVDHAIGDIRAFINLYQQEHQLSGRSIARVFHGIPSPCFPAQVWGRVRRFWRSHLNTDFNQLRILATRELINFR